MKRILSIVITAVLVMSLATVSAFAGAYSESGGCTTEVTIRKADPAAVIKDGIIGDGEYEKIVPNAGDVVITYEQAEYFNDEFINNVEFYMSWDETHGLNIAVVSTLLEEPKNLCTNEGSPTYAGQGFPSDEFLFQFGMQFSITEGPSDNLYRAISVNTETGEQLYGYYTYADGFAKGLTVQEGGYGKDFYVVVNGKTVTYEISFPLNAVLPAASLVNGLPAENAMMAFNLAATGGSKGLYHLYDNHEKNTTGEASQCYGVCLGDYGFMTNDEIEERSEAKGLFSSETIVKNSGGEENPPVENPPAENPPAENPPAENPPAENPPAENPPAENPPAENPPAENPPAENPNEGNNTPSAPQTADIAVIAAVVSAASAAGYAISRKRK